MSQSQSQSQPQRHEAVRVFATEFNESYIEFQDQEEVEDAEDDGSRAPKYYLLPSGGRANRVLMMGTCTEIDEVSSNPTTLRAKIVGETGNFFTYAGKYSAEARSVLENLEPPEHVMVVGKPNTYDTDDGDTYVSIDPENISIVDGATRQRWATETAHHTLDRLEAFDDRDAPYGDEAEQYYDFDLNILREDVREVVQDLTEGGSEPEADSEADSDDDSKADE